jgi:hypothetical protein
MAGTISEPTQEMNPLNRGVVDRGIPAMRILGSLAQVGNIEK